MQQSQPIVNTRLDLAKLLKTLQYRHCESEALFEQVKLGGLSSLNVIKTNKKI